MNRTKTELYSALGVSGPWESGLHALWVCAVNFAFSEVCKQCSLHMTPKLSSCS